MDKLKKLFPLSFMLSGNVGAFIGGLLIYMFGSSILSTVLAMLCIIPVIGWFILSPIISIVTTVISYYAIVGLVFLVMDFCKVFDKKEADKEADAE